MKSLLLITLSIVLVARVCLGQENGLCGKVPSGAVTIPSYKFLVLDKDGKQFENLKVTGQLLLYESKWGHTYQDWNWEDVEHITKIPVKFDVASGLYVSEEIKNVPVLTRKHPWILKTKCLDRFESLRFEFMLGEMFTPTEGYSGSFVFYFKNQKLGEFTLPDATKSIKITLHNWDGKKSL